MATSFPLKKNPSQTAHALTPKPFNLSSLGMPNHFALAPVDIITASASINFSSSIHTFFTSPLKSTLVAKP